MWAAAPVLGGFKASGNRLKLSRSMCLNMHFHLYIVQERLLEVRSFGLVGFILGGSMGRSKT